MNCLQAEELFSAHFEDELNYQTLKNLESHLTECERCEHEYILFEKSVKAVQQMPQVSPSPQFGHVLQQRISNDEELPANHLIQTFSFWKRLLSVCRRPRWAVSGILLLVIAVAGSYLYQENLFNRKQNPEMVGSNRTRENPKQSIQLPVPHGFNGTGISSPISTQPMQQRYILKRVSYVNAPTQGGL